MSRPGMSELQVGDPLAGFLHRPRLTASMRTVSGRRQCEDEIAEMTELIRDRYGPLVVVGEGGEGRIVKARDLQHDRFVALKLRAVATERGRRTNRHQTSHTLTSANTSLDRTRGLRRPRRTHDRTPASEPAHPVIPTVCHSPGLAYWPLGKT